MLDRIDPLGWSDSYPSTRYPPWGNQPCNPSQKNLKILHVQTIYIATAKNSHFWVFVQNKVHKGDYIVHLVYIPVAMLGRAIQATN